MKGKPKILIIKTGGTITTVRGADGVLAPFNDAVSLRKLVPELAVLAEVDVLALASIDSSNEHPIGTIGLTVGFTDAAVRRARRKPILNIALEPSVAMIPVYPGIKPEIISYLATTHYGIVVEGYGAGHIPTEGTPLIPAIREAVARGVPVVVCTQCLLGSTDMQMYHVGRAALEAGAIPGMDMTPEAALVKLMWALGQTRDMKSIESLMLKPFAGELREIAGGVHGPHAAA